jgi:hypothetical protein
MIVDREQLKRDCADALEALHRERREDGLHGRAGGHDPDARAGVPRPW